MRTNKENQSNTQRLSTTQEEYGSTIMKEKERPAPLPPKSPFE